MKSARPEQAAYNFIKEYKKLIVESVTSKV
jgi:hypothetical protein